MNIVQEFPKFGYRNVIFISFFLSYIKISIYFIVALSFIKLEKFAQNFRYSIIVKLQTEVCLFHTHYVNAFS